MYCEGYLASFKHAYFKIKSACRVLIFNYFDFSAKKLFKLEDQEIMFRIPTSALCTLKLVIIIVGSDLDFKMDIKCHFPKHFNVMIHTKLLSEVINTF